MEDHTGSTTHDGVDKKIKELTKHRNRSLLMAAISGAGAVFWRFYESTWGYNWQVTLFCGMALCCVGHTFFACEFHRVRKTWIKVKDMDKRLREDE